MIRLLTPDDAPAYVVLRRQMLLDSPWAFTATPDNDRGSDLASVSKSLAGPDYAIAGAFGDSRLLSVAVSFREANPKRAHLAWIVSVYTHPAARRRGLSRCVLALLLDQIRTWPDIASVLLQVSERAVEARALYESLGFVAWGIEPDAIRVGDGSYAETHMRLSLSATPAAGQTSN